MRGRGEGGGGRGKIEFWVTNSIFFLMLSKPIASSWRIATLRSRRNSHVARSGIPPPR